MADIQYDASQIGELAFLEAVRKRPGMYIGNSHKFGLHHILKEIVSNSVDEFMAGVGKTIKVMIAENGAVTVYDEGRGIPVDFNSQLGMSTLTQVLTRPHSGGKFGEGNSAYSSSGGMNGIGAKATNAMSEFLIAEVRRHGLIFRHRFEEGGIPNGPVEIFCGRTKIGEIDAATNLALDSKGLATAIIVSGKETPVASDSKQKSGTSIQFRPARKNFSRELEWPSPTSNVPWDATELTDGFRQLAYLYPGLKIVFLDERAENAEEQIFESSAGLVDYVKYLNEGIEALHKQPISFKGSAQVDTGAHKITVDVEVALQYAGDDTQIYSFVNGIYTPQGGIHTTALKTALTKAIKAFGSNKKLLKEDDDDVKGEDVLLGLTAVLKVSMSSSEDFSPQFSSQTKEYLTSPEANGPVFSTTYSSMSDYLEANIPVGKTIVNQAIAAARGRMAATAARKLTIKKSALDAGDSVLGKLADIQRRNGLPLVNIVETALYVVEGDSAGGSCKQGRYRERQAILPLRGKIPNVEKMDIREMLKNKEIQSIVASLGTGVGADCDVSLMRYGRFCILVDADVDGSHIATLLVTLVWRAMRPIMEAGRLFVALPPLYLVTNQKTKRSAYAYADSELEAVQKSLGAENLYIQRYKGLGEMNPSQLRETVFALPEGAAEKEAGGAGKKNGKAPEVLAVPALTMEHFAHRDLRLVIADTHRTRQTIETLMGPDAAPRKKWLMSVDWDE